jgi:hypothetical protein
MGKGGREAQLKKNAICDTNVWLFLTLAAEIAGQQGVGLGPFMRIIK